MSKQDRQGVRSPAGLEQKYNFGRISATERENARQDQEMTRQNLSMGEFISFASSAIDHIEKDIVSVKGLITALQKADTAFEKRAGEFQKSLDSQGKKLADLEKQDETIRKSIDDALNRITGYDTEISALAGSIAELTERVSALEELSTT